VNKELEILQQLLQRGDVRPSDIGSRLKALGFVMRPAKKAGHWVVAHPRLKGFRGTSFCCEHGRDGVLKDYGKRDLLAVLNRYQAQLQLFSNPREG
jgi:hypothetical protein